VAILLLVLVVSCVNFLLGFGLATHLGYGPDWSWLPFAPRGEEPVMKAEHHS
jgi:hypothetical protein